MAAKIQIISLIIVFVVLSGCDTSERISRLEKQNEDLKVQMEKNHVALDYQLQAKCAKDSRVWFNENFSRDKNTELLDFSNHYHKGSNQCFILVEYHYSEGAGLSWMNDMTLWNVYENSKYADFVEEHIINLKSAPQDNVVSCEMLGTKCTNLDQFNGFVQKYLNN